MEDERKTVLVLAYPGCIMFEVVLATQLLHEQFDVRLIAPGVGAFRSCGLLFQPDLALHEANFHQVAGILIPGGDPEILIEEPLIDHLLQEGLARNLILGGICAGVLVMAKTGILRGRKATHNYTPKYAPEEIVHGTERFWEGLEYRDEPLVQDGNILTAQPQAYVEFAVLYAGLLGAVPETAVPKLSAYYRGAGLPV